MQTTHLVPSLPAPRQQLFEGLVIVRLPCKPVNNVRSPRYPRTFERDSGIHLTIDSLGIFLAVLAYLQQSHTYRTRAETESHPLAIAISLGGLA